MRPFLAFLLLASAAQAQNSDEYRRLYSNSMRSWNPLPDLVDPVSPWITRDDLRALERRLQRRPNPQAVEAYQSEQRKRMRDWGPTFREFYSLSPVDRLEVIRDLEETSPHAAAILMGTVTYPRERLVALPSAPPPNVSISSRGAGK